METLESGQSTPQNYLAIHGMIASTIENALANSSPCGAPLRNSTPQPPQPQPLKPFFNLSSTEFVSNTIPIGHIPGGSGNGYATTITGAHDATSSAILIALGKIAYTDVTTAAQLDPCDVMVRITKLVFINDM